jgi:hypothetical protein
VPASRQTDATATSGSTFAPVMGRIPLDLVEAAGFRVTGGAEGFGVGFGRGCLGGALDVGVIVGAGELMHVHVGVGVGVGVGLLFMHGQVGVGVGFGFGLLFMHGQVGVGVGVLVVGVGVLVGGAVLVVVVGVGVAVAVAVAVQLSQPPERDRVTEATELPAVAASAVPPPHKASTAVASATTTEAAVHLMGHLSLWSQSITLSKQIQACMYGCRPHAVAD